MHPVLHVMTPGKIHIYYSNLGNFIVLPKKNTIILIICIISTINYVISEDQFIYRENQ